MPVVTLLGPRQSGKTTLVQHAFADRPRVSLEAPDERDRALADPRGFLARFPDGVVLDEVQRAPDLLSYLQVAVDEDRRPGRFILTGSQNLLLMERVSQTLAGRTAILHLYPLSIAELCGRSAFDPRRIDALPGPIDPPAADLWTTVQTGLYPAIHDRGLRPDRWLGDYIRTYVERDLREALRVMDLDGFQRFMRLAAARTGQELNLNDVASDAGISQPTARQWLTALRVGFLVEVLPAYHVSYRKRVRKRPKLHFLDTGLACALLGIRDAPTLEHHPLRGAIFESFVVSELVKAFAHAGEEPPLYHWRAAGGHELDVLVDLGDRQIPIEVKSGRTVAPDAVAGLRRWMDLPGNRNRGGVLVHGGDTAFELHGVVVRPWFLG